MTDHTKLKLAAETVKQAYAELCEHGGDALAEAWNTAELEYDDAANPDVVLALIAENERLTADCSSMRGSLKAYAVTTKKLVKDGSRAARERDKLRAEVAGLKTGYEAYERLNAELKADNEALRNSLIECTNSLQGEMLQKFGGQLPEDMHPVTRREYDRDIAEVSGYRAALGQGEQL